MPADNRLIFPAVSRNFKPIVVVLKEFLPKSGVILELASGSGEHAVRFQSIYPKISWQASDVNEKHLLSISSWIHYEGLEDLMPDPIFLDVSIQPWKLPPAIAASISGIVCINMLHVASWSCAEALFNQCSRILKNDGPLIIYGPFMRNGIHTSESNLQFHTTLLSINSSWGLRDVVDITRLALGNGLEVVKAIEMPANNLCLIFRPFC